MQALNYDVHIPGYMPLRWNPQMDTSQQNVNSPAAAFPHLDPNGSQNLQVNQDPQYEMKSKFGYVGYNPRWRAFSDTIQGIGSFFANRKTQQEAKDYQRQQSNPLLQLPYNPNTSQQSLYGTPQYKGGGWIKKAINPAHKGWCTPLSNPHCTGHRRALALRFKHHKLELGGEPEPKPAVGAGDLGHKAMMSDLISFGLVGTGSKEELAKNRNMLYTNASQLYGDDRARKLVDNIYFHSKRNEMKSYSPEQRISSYYGITSPDADVQGIKDQFKNFARSGPQTLYRDSPNVEMQNQSMAKLAEGGPSADKAKEMLRDGTAQGHKLTDKQKRYFGWIAGGKKAEGGFSDTSDDDEMQDLKDELEDKIASLNQQPAGNEETNEPAGPEESDEDQQMALPQDQGMAEAYFNQSGPGPGEDDNPEEEPNPVETARPGPAPIAGDVSGNPLIQAFKHGIANVEGAGYHQKNANSSALGKYQIIDSTRESLRKQFFSKINKQDFDNAYKTDPQFQERVMDVYSSHLLGKYSNPHQAAIAYYLGEGNAGRVAQPSYRPTKNNATVGQYLKGFDKGYHFKEGGEYELTNVQIAQLRKQGYQIETI